MCIQEAQCKNVIDTAVSKFKRIDILVNNAAYQGKQLVNYFDLKEKRYY
jgi:NAD(P)-dependent dehydrogenase (short-subunit alcohol dehydrogenase family)